MSIFNINILKRSAAFCGEEKRTTKIKQISVLLLGAAITLALIPRLVFAAGGVAKIGDQEYASLTEAITNAGTNATTIVLQINTNECIDIPASANITLDLNGKRLANSVANKHTIVNSGTLTITGSMPGGVIDNLNDNVAALFNNIGGTVTINDNVTLIKSADDGTEYNSWYTVANRGTMTINGGLIHNPGGYTSTITNGFLSPQDYFPDVPSVYLTINGGTISGGKNSIKNDSAGVLVINDGAIINDQHPTILNWNVATINGGTFTSNLDVIALGKYIWSGAQQPSEPTEKGETTINGGTFTGPGIFGTAASSNADTYKVTITEGTFNGAIRELPNATFTVSGGKFRDALPTNAVIPDDYELILDNDNYYYLQVKSQPTLDLKILEGANQTYVIGSNKNVVIKSSGDLSYLGKIQIDGVDIDPAHYDVGIGSTILTLKPAFLDTLSVGNHTVTLAYSGGSASNTGSVSTKLTVVKNNPNENGVQPTSASNPYTGDGILFSVMALSLSILGVTSGALIISKRVIS